MLWHGPEVRPKWKPKNTNPNVMIERLYRFFQLMCDCQHLASLLLRPVESPPLQHLRESESQKQSDFLHMCFGAMTGWMLCGIGFIIADIINTVKRKIKERREKKQLEANAKTDNE